MTSSCVEILETERIYVDCSPTNNLLWLSELLENTSLEIQIESRMTGWGGDPQRGLVT